MWQIAEGNVRTAHCQLQILFRTCEEFTHNVDFSDGRCKGLLQTHNVIYLYEFYQNHLIAVAHYYIVYWKRLVVKKENNSTKDRDKY